MDALVAVRALVVVCGLVRVGGLVVVRVLVEGCEIEAVDASFVYGGLVVIEA